MTAPVPVLRAKAIRKQFGQVIANDGVDLELRRGEIHALVGENGAGKSTLMNILFGMLRPDGGHVEIDGEPVNFHTAADAIAAGIGMVHQHFMLVPEFSVLRNVTLGAEPRRFGFIDKRATTHLLAEPMRLVGLDVDVRRAARELSVAEQQRVEIAKVLFRGARIMILDEPTAVLTPQETVQLFETLRRLADSGVAVVFITHKLREVMDIADRVTVLRQGRTHGTFDRSDVEIPGLVALMTGRSDIQLGRLPRPTAGNSIRIRVADLAGRHAPDSAIEGISFAAREGEIVGVAGVDGNGQNTLVALITGTERATSGTVRIDGDDVTSLSIASRRERGLGYVPEDRHADGLPLHAPVVDALAVGKLTRLRGLRLFGPAITGATKSWAKALIARYDVKVASINNHSSSLSGGNQQKIVLARELESRPRLMVMAQPTRGVDIGAAEGIYRSILELTSTGAAVIVVSADLDELLRLADRILVFYRGDIVAELDAATTSRDELGLAMAGHLMEAA